MSAPSVWVLLRGLTRGRHHWGEFLHTWQQQFPAARLVVLDVAGNGDRYQECSPSSVVGMVEDCRAQLHALGVVSGFGVLAVSMGGMIAVEWARLYPLEISRLVLINTSMRPFSPVFDRMKPRALLALLWLFISRAKPQRWEQTIAYLTSTTITAGTVEAWIAVRLSQPVRTGNALRQLAAAANFNALQARPKLPVLVMASVHDRLVSVKCSQAISAGWGVPLLLHPDAGHDLTLDDGMWVASAVARWLGQD